MERTDVSVGGVDHPICSRRRFLSRSMGFAGAALAAPALLGAEGAKPTATDKVPLGKTGLKICRLGMGTGSQGGSIQRALGQEGFTKLVRHAYDRGVRFIDTADMYKTHEMVREAIKGLPRDELWIQSKMMWEPAVPEKPLEVLDRFRKELGVDFIDSLLIHCATTTDWPEKLKVMTEAFTAAKEKGIIRSKGVSCHGLPALTTATKTDWIDVHLVRVNPQGRHVDGPTGKFSEPGKVPEAMKEIAEMHRRGRGIIGMKIIGNGDFQGAADREKSIHHAMTCGFVDAIIVGFASAAEVDETIGRMNKALAEKA